MILGGRNRFAPGRAPGVSDVLMGSGRPILVTPPIPTRSIQARSLTIPSSVTLPSIQCHQTRGRAELGGSRNCSSRLSTAGCGAPSPASPARRGAMGEMAARICLGLQGFAHAGADHVLQWDVKQAGRLRPLLPAIADPGASVVRAAHELGVPVVPLVGPISLMLALAASGLNGQSFAFVGYVPQDAHERTQRLRELEAMALKTGQTQILIETPYRNAALLQGMLQTLHPHTRLAVCGALTLPQQVCRSALVNDWKRDQRLAASLPLDAPCVFLLGR